MVLTPYTLLLLGVSLCCAVLAATAWRRWTDVLPNFPFWYLASIAWAALCYALMLDDTDLEAQYLFVMLRYLGDLVIVLSMLLVVLWYTGQRRWLTGRRLAALAALPALHLLTVFTNSWHHLYYSQVWLSTSGPVPLLAKSNGPLYWIFISVIYIYLLLSNALLLRYYLRSTRAYRAQAGLLLLGTSAPVLAHLAYLVGLRLWEVLNPTYFAYALTGLAFSLNLLRFRLIELRPIVREAVMENVSAGVVALNPMREVVEMNPAARRILGAAAPLVSGQPLAELSPVLDGWLRGGGSDATAAQADLVLAALPDGTPRTFAVELTSVREHDQLTGWIVFMSEVTARVQAEARLRQSEEKLRFVTTSVADILYMTDRDYRLTYASPAITRFLGYSVEEALNLPPQDLLVEEAYGVLHERLQAAARDFAAGLQERYLGRVDTLQLQFRGRTGQWLWGETSFSYLAGPQGEFAGLIGITRDIAQRREQEQHQLAQQRALSALEERERLARELHDSLGQVMGYINVQSQAALAHLENGQAELSRAALQHLAELAQNSYGDLRELLLGLRQKFREGDDFYTELEIYLGEFTRLYDLPVSLQLPPAGQRPLLSPNSEVHLLRIIQEALSNVRKHARASRARVFFAAAGGSAQVIIEDDGVGFDPTAPAGAVEGTEPGGHFGQQIMRDRAAELGGSLQVRSAPGQGAQVIVSLPLAGPQEQAPRLGGLRVLLADDHPLFRDGMKNLLAARGINVVAMAKDGAEAVERAMALRPDVAILDIHMPQKDGLEATREIKLKAPEVRILIMTMAASEEVLFKAIRAGASGYLLKDLKAEDFLSQLEGLVRGETPISPSLAEKLLQEFAKTPPPAEESLNERQLEILRLMAARLTYAQIAERLFLSESTIKYHAAQIMEKLHATSRSELLNEAARRGWIDRRKAPA